MSKSNANNAVTRQKVHLINPASGKKRKLARLADELKSKGEEAYFSEKEGDIERLAEKLCLENPFVHLIIHGGDGSLCEAVNGIMKAGAGETAAFSGIPSGTGNDFLRYMAERSKAGRGDNTKEICVDLILANGRYVLNMINIGFDCDVVADSIRLRHANIAAGPASYVLGVCTALVRKNVFCANEITMHSVTEGIGNAKKRDEITGGEYLLLSVANAPYCGGGFKAAPLALPDDGRMDVLMAKNISRRKFVSLVGDYRRGTHVNTQTGMVKGRFRECLEYRQMKEISFGGMKQICCDGEILDASYFNAKIVPHAVHFILS